MGNSGTGLYSNPYFHYVGGESFEEYASQIDIYMANKTSCYYDFDIKGLMNQHNLVCTLFTEIQAGVYTMEKFVKNFEMLLQNLLVVKGDNFLELLQVLNEIIMSVLMVKECRHLFIQNLDTIKVILQRVIVEGTVDSRIPVNEWKIVYFFIINKFKKDSKIDDSALFDVAMKSCFGNNKLNIETFCVLSAYKNCDKFDMSWEDILSKYQLNHNKEINYFWIYTPFVVKYKNVFEDIVLNLIRDNIYDSWFEYVSTKTFRDDHDKLTPKELLSYVTDIVSCFSDNGVYPYDSKIILRMIRKEIDNGQTVNKW